MLLTPNREKVLRALRRYFYLRASQLRDLLFPGAKDGGFMRGLLRGLEEDGYIRRHVPSKIDPSDPSTTAPIWALTLKGSNILAAHTGDCSLLLTIQPSFADYLSMNHYCALSSIHIQIDRAFAVQQRVKMTNLYFEHEQVCPDEDPSKRFRLQTVVHEEEKQGGKEKKRILCCPDTAYETDLGGLCRAWYTEREMGSDTPSRVAAKKHKGYYYLARKQLYKKHFPQAQSMRVLVICPSPGWRDSLRKAFKDGEGKPFPGAELWLFVAVQDVTAAKFLSEPILYGLDKGPLPFVPTPALAPAGTTGGGESAGSEKASVS